MRVAIAALLLLAPPALAIGLVDFPHPVPDVLAGFTVAPLAAVPVPTAIMFGPGDGDGPDLYAPTLLGTVYRVPLLWTPAQVPALAGPPEDTGVQASAPLGIAFEGGVMYIADSHAGAESGRTDGRVWRITPDGTQTAIVDGLPNGRHNTNHLRFGPDGRLYISNGNPNDNGRDGGDSDVFPFSGAFLSVDTAQVAASPAILHWDDESGNPIPDDQIATHPRNADFNSKVEVLAYGFRNIFGIAFSAQGIAYTGMNGADEPSSQDAFYRITPGGTNYGFPFCYDVGTPGGVGAQVTKQPNPIFPSAVCSDKPTAEALLGWHTCATGIDLPRPGAPWAFPDRYQNSAYVGECAGFFAEDLAAQLLADPTTAHHSTSHKVVRVALDAEGHAVEVSDFLTGLALPTDVLFGPDGAMYVADAEGVLRVAPALPALPEPVPGVLAPVLALLIELLELIGL